MDALDELRREVKRLRAEVNAIRNGDIRVLSAGDADVFLRWYNSSTAVAYSNHFGFANLQDTAPAGQGTLNVGIRHTPEVVGVSGDQSCFSTWLNGGGLIIEVAGAWRYVIDANYDYVRLNAALSIPDPFPGGVAPGVDAGFAVIYVDPADNDLKVKFSDGTVKTIVTDT